MLPRTVSEINCQLTANSAKKTFRRGEFNFNTLNTLSIHSQILKGANVTSKKQVNTKETSWMVWGWMFKQIVGWKSCSIRQFCKCKPVGFKPWKITNLSNIRSLSEWLSAHQTWDKHMQKHVIVYRKGDIVKQPMKKGSFVPKNVPGVGWGRVGHTGVGWVM